MILFLGSVDIPNNKIKLSSPPSSAHSPRPRKRASANITKWRSSRRRLPTSLGLRTPRTDTNKRNQSTEVEDCCLPISGTTIVAFDRERKDMLAVDLDEVSAASPVLHIERTI